MLPQKKSLVHGGNLKKYQTVSSIHHLNWRYKINQVLGWFLCFKQGQMLIENRDTHVCPNDKPQLKGTSEQHINKH
jgi:hypothetical protein